MDASNTKEVATEGSFGPVDTSSEVETDLLGAKKSAANVVYNNDSAENTMDRSNISADGESANNLDDEDPLANVIPVEKLKNGAANAIEFLNWGFNNLKVQAEKVQETESFGKLEEAMTTVRERANSAYEASKPKIQQISQVISDKATEVYEVGKPAMDDIAATAKSSLESARETVVTTTEACKPGVYKAAEKANDTLQTAISETKSLFEPRERDD